MPPFVPITGPRAENLGLTTRQQRLPSNPRARDDPALPYGLALYSWYRLGTDAVLASKVRRDRIRVNLRMLLTPYDLTMEV